MHLRQNDTFGTLQINFYLDSKRNVFITIDQLAKGFGYRSKSAIENMIMRNSYLKDEKFSVVAKIPIPVTYPQGGGTSNSSTDSLGGTCEVLKEYETRLFNKRGIYEIGMLSRTEQGKQFRQWIYDHIELLERENARQEAQRIAEKPERRTLTDAIKEWPHANKWSYKAVTDLLLKAATGKSAKAIRLLTGAAVGLDGLSSAELAKYRTLEQVTIALIGAGADYGAIKAAVENLSRKETNHV